jgi:hypothetical protein
MCSATKQLMEMGVEVNGMCYTKYEIEGPTFYNQCTKGGAIDSCCTNADGSKKSAGC